MSITLTAVSDGRVVGQIEVTDERYDCFAVGSQLTASELRMLAEAAEICEQAEREAVGW